MRAAEVFRRTAVIVLAAAAPAAAQQSGQAQQGAAGSGEIELRFEREVYIYPGASRRDPFTPLTRAKTGPLFEDLSLQGIIYSETPGRSVVLLKDDGGVIHRVRRGDIVGNSRVLEIAPLRVIFAVENFGIVRQESLELKRIESEGAR